MKIMKYMKGNIARDAEVFIAHTAKSV